ncbi:MAG: xanthine dehydrogenase molybdopterin binding subunit [Tenuifilaceae bacterium]|jgi:xanthine dehydrogenase molybdopterin binding subunit|nr:xanthine dehydrogenase molybdopterin binding subunit [Tenuifilaceae bacterium]
MNPHEIHHDSAEKHVSGESIYINDMDCGSNMLFGKVLYSSHAHARIISIDTKKASVFPGVCAILTAEDIPGQNQMGPVVHDEPCLAQNEVTFVGQAIALIAAQSMDIAQQAAKLIDIQFEELPAITTLEQAMAKGEMLGTPRIIKRGDVSKGFEQSAHRLTGTLLTGAQEHWYLETQSCLCIPGEHNEMNVYSSTQHPSETQAIVAEVLGVTRNEVVVETRRMGGAFGGKETQANHVAAWAALLAKHTRKPVKIHLFRDDDQIMTGKRHPFISTYEVGFDADGRILAYNLELNANAGAATDLSIAILERAVFHADNAYFIPNISVVGKAWKTNLPSNTAFRGFGGPQGMAVIENAIDRIAHYLKKDAAEVRYINFYGLHSQNTTHYEQLVENNRLFTLYEQLVSTSHYFDRRAAVKKFNNNSKYVKRGLALTPIKFGISFTTSFLNQAGALVNIYQDGTVLMNHGGTEMGQGLHTKMLQVAASELGISPQHIKVNATNTSKVPNTSATAASSGSDLNGMAVKNATDKLRKRLAPLAAKLIAQRTGSVVLDDEIVFANDLVFHPKHPEQSVLFPQLIASAYLNQISLSATGFYKTPDIHFDKDKGRGKPFHYFAFGMAVAEVEVDMLTGHYRNIRTDILHDAGKSINRQIDLGQVEGAFIQGVGWCTTEVIKWTPQGHLLNHSPDTYKIPSVQDTPPDFRVKLLQDAPNPNTIKQSKAVGEPPFMLAFAVWLAIKDALASIADYSVEPEFELPASNEVILKSARKLYGESVSGI